MNLINIGINHKTAPIEVREKFFLNSTEQDLLLSELKCNASVIEALVLSTCNRTEVYANVLDFQYYVKYFVQLITSIKKIKYHPNLHEHFYIYQGEKAIEHFLRVAAGLDSLVLGERQILGQVRSAIERAQNKQMFQKNFNILSNIAIRTGKKAQTETFIGQGGSSISRVAVTLAEKQLNSLNEKVVLVIGAGKMSELAIEQINKKGIKKLYLMNRTPENAKRLAHKLNGTPASFIDLKDILIETDVCFCAASAPHYILDKIIIEKVMELRNHRKLILIDISMPRNIDPKVANLTNVHLSHLDDLDKVVGETMKKRKEAVMDVEKIIAAKLIEFSRKLNKLNDSLSYPELLPQNIS